MENEREHSKFIIQRFDSYISGANTKGNFLLAFNTFLCGSVIANYKTLSGLIEDVSALKFLSICLFALFIIGLVTTGLIMKAVYPFLNSGNSTKEKYHSLIFFNSIAQYESDRDFMAAFQQQSNEGVNEDMAKQSFYLAKALKLKYKVLAWAMRLVFAELILLFITLLLISIY